MSKYVRSDSAEGAVLAFIVGVVTLLPQILWEGLVVKTIWNWFIPETFHGAPHLSMAQAVGISLVVSTITSRRVASSSEEEAPLEAVLNDLLYSLIMGIIFLLTGAVVHQYL